MAELYAEREALAGAGEDADALAALGLPTGFGGQGRSARGGHPPRAAPRRESSGLMASLPAPAGEHTRFGSDESEAGAGQGDGDGDRLDLHGPPPPAGAAGPGGGAPPPQPSPPSSSRAGPPPGDHAPSPPPPPPPPRTSSSPPRHGPPSDPGLAKYWKARHYLWGPVYEAGILMDGEGWFSATPATTAAHQARRLIASAEQGREDRLAAKARKGEAAPAPSPSPGLDIIDAFCGCGGNAARLAALAPPGSTVWAVDTEAGRAAATGVNVRLLLSAAGEGSGGGRGGAEVRVVVADFLSCAETMCCPAGADAVFMSPPWGGPAYKRAAVMRLGEDLGGLGVGLRELVRAAAAACAAAASPPIVAVFLPRNSCLRDIVAAGASLGLAVEVQREVVNCRVRSVTAYFGGAVDVDEPA